MSDNIPRFGASEFFLAQTDPLALREQLRTSLSALLGREVLDADPHMVLASAFLPYLVQGQASADACAKATLRAYAKGQDLDRIANATCVVGYVDRKPATGAVLAAILQCTVTRSSTQAQSDCKISWEGQREMQNSAGDSATFSGSGSVTIHFALAEGATKQVAVPIYLRCETEGSAFNACGSDVTSIVEDADLTGSLTVTATEAPSTVTGQTYTVSSVSVALAGETYGGHDIESDEAFAQRVAWQAKAIRVPGSLEYFRLALSEISLLASAFVAPAVDSQGRIVMAWADKPNFLASLNGLTLTDRGEAFDEFRSIVQSSLLVEQHVYAYPAKWYDSSSRMVVGFMLDASTQDLSAAIQAVSTAFLQWRNGVAWHCGAAIRESEVAAVLTNAGACFVDAESYRMPPDSPLPADSLLLASQIEARYDGLAEASIAPIGGEGEDITPI